MSGDVSSNIQQRVFDLFPPYPQPVTLYSLILALSCFTRMSVIEAVRRLREAKVVESEPGTRCCVYRRRKGSRRPIDMRGHHANSGRRAKCP